MKPGTDLRVANRGSVTTLVAMTKAGSEWMDENLKPEPWQWLGGALVIDSRFAEGIIEGAIEDGLEVDAQAPEKI